MLRRMDLFADSFDACALSEALHARTVSCLELMSATLDRIDALNPQVNAVVSLQPREALLEQARERDAELARGESRGWMHGFPMAIKDLSETAGVPSTQGSPLLAKYLPQRDSLMVERMKAAGGIVIGKTNTPEFGLGSHTVNPVFGATRNAYDLSRSAGGSSGGATVSLALRLQPVADGSDMMGSLRNPAAWANVFGFRPSFGRVPKGPPGDGFFAQLATDGPMGRTVRDVAMLLSVQAGRHEAAPLSLPGDGREFASLRAAPLKGLRVGWLGDLGGHLPMEPGVIDACETGLTRMAAEGARIEPLALGFAPERVWSSWQTLRHWQIHGALGLFLQSEAQRAQLKPDLLWELSQGAALSGADVHAASTQRTALHRHVAALFERFDLLALPSAQVWPFMLDAGMPRQIAGRELDTYHRWMEVTVLASLLGLPTLNVPAGFNEAGLPMGLQLIGKPLADAQVLQAGLAYEPMVADWLARRPPLLSA
jgi:amidase